MAAAGTRLLTVLMLLTDVRLWAGAATKARAGRRAGPGCWPPQSGRRPRPGSLPCCSVCLGDGGEDGKWHDGWLALHIWLTHEGVLSSVARGA